MYMEWASHILENLHLFKNKIAQFHSVVFIVLVLSAQILNAADTKSNWIEQSIDLTINTRFAAAESLLFGRIVNGDSTTETWFYITSMLNSKMTHYENQVDEKAFLNAINQVQSNISILDMVVDRHDSLTQARQFFYRGSASGYLAFFQGQNGEWFDALDNGLQSIGDLEKAVVYDSTLYDAWLGIGVYQYWRSTRLKYLNWMPFVRDQREEGIANIRKAAQKSRYSRYLAMHQLIYILLNYGAKDEALKYANEAVHKYPQSIFMHWAYAHTRYMRHEYVKAIEAYKKLSELLDQAVDQNPNHQISCLARLAEMYYNDGRDTDALREAMKSIQLSRNVKLSKEGKKGVKKAQRILGILDQ